MKANRNFSDVAVVLAVLIIGAAALLVYIKTVPEVWWDEGWTLNVARNWVEDGHYGQKIDGSPRAPGLSGAFPIVAPVALSFCIFGVGVWQGRLSGVLFTLGSLALIYMLGCRLYNRKIALGALAVLIFLTGAQQLQPLLIGRQVLGEMPAMFWLLLGASLMLLAINKSGWFVILTAIAWGVALATKAQVYPFWLIAIIVSFAVAIYKRWWREVVLLALSCIGALLLYRYFTALQRLIIGGNLTASDPISGLLNVTAYVFSLPVRASALVNVLMFGLLTLLGITYALIISISKIREQGVDRGIYLVKWQLIGISGSWLVWYLLFGMYFTRYLFPPVFLGSIFASVLLYELTNSFDWRATIQNASTLILMKKIALSNVGALFAIIIVSMLFAITSKTMFFLFTNHSDSLEQVTQYINKHTPDDALIESYESELFFLLDRNYHYPPDQVHVDLIQRLYIEPATNIDYDPLTADPDYLVDGPFSTQYQLYTHILDGLEFERVFSVESYVIYQRNYE